MIGPVLHAWLLGGASVAALLFAAIILARNPQSTPARLHAVFGFAIAWWFFCMAEIAVAATPAQVELFARLLQLSICMLPGIIFHLNVVTSGTRHLHRRAIRIHYGGSFASTVFCLFWPALFAPPNEFAWGFYPAYTAWGFVPVAALGIVMAEVLWHYRALLRAGRGNRVYQQKLRSLYYGNAFTMLAMVDFLPAFGIGLYPLGYLILTTIHAATMVASVRFRLIEVTPEIAANEILQAMPDALLVVDNQGLIRVSNRAAARLFDLEPREVVDQPLEMLVERLHPNLRAALKSAGAAGSALFDVEYVDGSGIERSHSVTATQVVDDDGGLVAKIWILRDHTELHAAQANSRRLEEWIRHTQKLETLGVMAGGIAHDFNNLLMSILGAVELARMEQADAAPVTRQLDTIQLSANRAAELTTQLLTYAGRGRMVKTPLNLNALIRDMSELVRAAVSKKATLEFELDDDTPPVMADASQLRQIILNLVTNASEALGSTSGVITITTGTVDKRELPMAAQPTQPAQGYAALAVRDTGAGMTANTRERMFEPFFTTKYTGRGLGLSMVMGIVKGHGGTIEVVSTPGTGTTIRVVLPTTTEQPKPQSTPPPETIAWTGQGVALLADDELPVRQVARAMIEETGFEVIEATTGAEAVSAFAANRDRITLLVLDLTMPEMGGVEAAARIREIAGDVPTVFISGHAPVDIVASIPAGSEFLHKPFGYQALVAALRRVSTGAADTTDH